MSKGGFHFGNVGGGVNVKAGSDVVAGDKTGRDKTTTTTIEKGFAGDEQKQQLAARLGHQDSGRCRDRWQIRGEIRSAHLERSTSFWVAVERCEPLVALTNHARR